MKLSVALFASFLTGALSKEISISSVRADSKFGMDLLSKSRRVEDAEADEDAEQDGTWIAGFALKFQGCHHITQWNAQAEDDEDVRIETRRLARFRLCPVSSCNDNSGFGCRSGYGDYIVDMDDFLQSFYENKMEEQQSKCEEYMQYNCYCEDNGQFGEYYTEEDCYNKCYKSAGMNECVEEEQEAVYYNGVEIEQIAVEDYLQCAQYKIGGRRRLEEDAEEEGDGNLYVGPYCSDQGGKIVLGMFTDEECTNFADDYGGRMIYRTLTGGQDLPNSSESIVDTKCYTCEAVDEEQEYAYKRNGKYYDEDGNQVEMEQDYAYARNGKYYDEDGNQIEQEAPEVKETCTNLYQTSGKCEEKLSWSGFTGNSNACTYIEGIKITRSDGLIMRGPANSNKVASAFISLFGVAFVGLGSYVYYLKTKLDRGTINLN